MLERQHRSIKDSLKAALLEMAEKHEDKWLDHLPFVILGKNATLQPDIGASPSELSFGMNMAIPGQILMDPGDLPDGPELHEILQRVRKNTLNTVSQPSRHSAPEKELPGVPDGATHAYTKQHQTTGLQCPYEGPFKIIGRPSRSTIKLLVGHYRSGEERYEVRHINDLKFAHPDSMAAPASRPTLGRPPTSVRTDTSTTTKSSSGADSQNGGQINKPATAPSTHAEDAGNSSVNKHSKVGGRNPTRSTRNPNPLYVDSMQFSGPPPHLGFPTAKSWSASTQELAAINASIGGA